MSNTSFHFQYGGVPAAVVPTNEPPAAPVLTSVPMRNGDVPLNQLAAEMRVAQNAGLIGGETQVSAGARKYHEQHGDFDIPGCKVAGNAQRRISNQSGQQGVYYVLPVDMGAPDGIRKVILPNDADSIPADLKQGTPCKIRVAPNSVNGRLKYYLEF